MAKPKTIPRDVLVVAGEVIASLLPSHNKLEMLFADAGVPGEPPEGNMVEKSQAWLARLNQDESISEPFVVLEELLVPFVHSEDAQNDVNRLKRVLEKHGYTLSQTGKIVSAQVKSVATEGEKMSGLSVFISHSSADAELAESVADLLVAALSIPTEEVRCTSVPGYKLPVGASSDEQLRIEVVESRVLVGIITKASMKSVYVLFELGARWAVKKPMAPLLGAGANASVMSGPLSGINALSCTEDDLLQFVLDVGRHLSRPAANTPAYLRYIRNVVSRSNALGEADQDSENNDIAADENPLSSAENVLVFFSQLGQGSSEGQIVSLAMTRAGKEFVAGDVQLSFGRDERRSASGYEAALTSLVERKMASQHSSELFTLTPAGFSCHADGMLAILCVAALGDGSVGIDEDLSGCSFSAGKASIRIEGDSPRLRAVLEEGINSLRESGLLADVNPDHGLYQVSAAGYRAVGL